MVWVSSWASSSKPSWVWASGTALRKKMSEPTVNARAWIRSLRSADAGPAWRWTRPKSVPNATSCFLASLTQRHPAPSGGVDRGLGARIEDSTLATDLGPAADAPLPAVVILASGRGARAQIPTQGGHHLMGDRVRFYLVTVPRRPHLELGLANLQKPTHGAIPSPALEVDQIRDTRVIAASWRVERRMSRGCRRLRAPEQGRLDGS